MVFRYYYKYIVNGQWCHSTASPAERDESGNVNNVIVIGDTASVRPIVQQQKKVSVFLFCQPFSCHMTFILPFNIVHHFVNCICDSDDSLTILLGRKHCEGD